MYPYKRICSVFYYAQQHETCNDQTLMARIRLTVKIFIGHL